MPPTQPPSYDRLKSYQWNYAHAPQAPAAHADDCALPGDWTYCGLPARSPLGVAAGPLLNGRWCLHYAALGFDVVTYKTVRSSYRPCYDLPNLQPVGCEPRRDMPLVAPAIEAMQGTWAVSFGMPSQSPEVWRADVEWTRRRLPADKLLAVSVVGTDRNGSTLDQLADDYARCAAWAVESGADVVEANLSCPNVSTSDGQLYHHPMAARLVAQRLRRVVGRRPLILKIGHLTSPAAATALIEAVSPYADALAMTNSIAARVRRQEGGLLFGGQRRGICGKATLAASLAQVGMFAAIVKRLRSPLRLVGVGGASCLADVEAYLAAGAEAVQMATAAMTDPLAALAIKRQWPGADRR